MRAQEFVKDYAGLSLKISRNADGVAIRAYGADGARELGMAEFFFDEQGRLDPQTVWVDERRQGQGIAAAMYDYLKSQGYTIVRSWDQTDAGRGFWDKHRGPEATVWEASPYTARMSGFDANNPVHVQFANFWKMTLRKKAQVPLEEAWGIFQRQGEVCALTGKPFSFDRAGNWDMISADQINPSAGYTADNIQFVRWGVNSIKMNMPQSSFISLCEHVLQNVPNLRKIALASARIPPSNVASVLPSATGPVRIPTSQIYDQQIKSIMSKGFNPNSAIHQYWIQSVHGMLARQKQGIGFDIEQAWYIFHDIQQERCAYTGLPFGANIGKGFLQASSDWTSPSPDQIIPGGGYRLGNTVWVLWIVNKGKSNLSLQEYVNLAKEVYSHAAQRNLSKTNTWSQAPKDPQFYSSADDYKQREPAKYKKYSNTP